MTLAVLLAPLVALQLQKIIEAWKEVRQRKRWIYLTLMTTRHAQLSFEHVRALNMIDLEFTKSTGKEAAVRTAWKTYLNYLADVPKDDDQPAMAVWTQRKLELFTELLSTMGNCVGYNFDPVHIQKGIYAPRGHFNDEMEQRETRQKWLEMLRGERVLKMQTSVVPANEAAAQEGKKFLQAMQSINELSEGKRPLHVVLQPEEKDKITKLLGDE